MLSGSGKIVIRQGGLLQSSSSMVVGGSSGYLLNFTIHVSEVPYSNLSYFYIFDTSLSRGDYTSFRKKRNFDNITLYIGGYKQSIDSGAFFQGCLSDFTFQGVDIISTYFQQYPNNTNPVRGDLTTGSFRNVAQTCSDALSTAQPTATQINFSFAKLVLGCITLALCMI